MRPPAAIAWTVRIAFAVARLMMYAVGAYPEDRSALKGESGTSGKEILNPFWNLISPIPKLREKYQRMAVTSSAFQLNMNSAATAPI